CAPYAPRPPPARASIPTRRSSDLSGRLSCFITIKPWNNTIFNNATNTFNMLFLIRQDHMTNGSPHSHDHFPWGNYSHCGNRSVRSEEHTSELQSRFDLVCRLLLEK